MDLDSVKSEVITREFVAVVLAGFGDGCVIILGPLSTLIERLQSCASYQ